MNRKKFYPVIHCIPASQDGVDHALANVRSAESNGADGVFLIGHAMRHEELILIYDQVRKAYPSLWLGINFLDIGASRNWIDLFAAAKSCSGLNGLWIDRLPDSRMEMGQTIAVFGGVAFKYDQPHLSGNGLVNVCEKAVHTVNIATTSGDKTGSPPTVEKLEEIRKLLAGRIPLAVASGISTSNVALFLPYVDCFLVASSLIEYDKSRDGKEYLVPERVRELADLIHG